MLVSAFEVSLWSLAQTLGIQNCGTSHHVLRRNCVFVIVKWISSSCVFCHFKNFKLTHLNTSFPERKLIQPGSSLDRFYTSQKRLWQRWINIRWQFKINYLLYETHRWFSTEEFQGLQGLAHMSAVLFLFLFLMKTNILSASGCVFDVTNLD